MGFLTDFIIKVENKVHLMRWLFSTNLIGTFDCT